MKENMMIIDDVKKIPKIDCKIDLHVPAMKETIVIMIIIDDVRKMSKST